MSMPNLETERLILRKITEADEDALHAILSDPVVMRFYPMVCDRAQTRDWLQRILNRYEKDGHAFWGVIRKDTGDFIGQCGILVQDVGGAIENEIGYLFARAHWHLGFATEAAHACRDHGFNEHGFTRFISIIHPENTPSIRVAERNGMTLEKYAPFKDMEGACIYSMTRDDVKE